MSERNLAVGVMRGWNNACRLATSKIDTVVSIGQVPVGKFCGVPRRLRAVEAVRSKRTVVHSDGNVTVHGGGGKNWIAKVVDTSDGDLLVRHGHRSRETAAGAGYRRRGIGAMEAKEHAAVARVLLVLLVLVLVHSLWVEGLRWQAAGLGHRASKVGRVKRRPHVVVAVVGNMVDWRRRESRRRVRN